MFCPGMSMLCKREFLIKDSNFLISIIKFGKLGILSKKKKKKINRELIYN